MITLKNVKHDEAADEILIDFSYDGEWMMIDKAQIKLDKNEWIKFKTGNVPDEEMIEHLLQNELHYLVNYLGRD